MIQLPLIFHPSNDPAVAYVGRYILLEDYHYRRGGVLRLAPAYLRYVRQYIDQACTLYIFYINCSQYIHIGLGGCVTPPLRNSISCLGLHYPDPSLKLEKILRSTMSSGQFLRTAQNGVGIY